MKRSNEPAGTLALRSCLLTPFQLSAWLRSTALPRVRAVALKNGLWPGVSSGPKVEGRGDETASASREPWVDSNGYWISYLRTLYPKRPALLGYSPPSSGERLLPFDSLELALIESRVHGGNFVLELEPRYRAALLAGDAKAVAAWSQLAQTAKWLSENRGLFGHRALPTMTALVESGQATAEIANLLFRRNASPTLARADDPPPPHPDRLAVVAANLRPPAPPVWARILAHAEAGASVVATGFNTGGRSPARSEPDREFYPVGRGQVVAYRKPVADPSEFALDVIDIVTHKRRPVRLWNAPSVIATVALSPKGGTLLHAINYGSPIEGEVQARVQGQFGKATLLRPDAPSRSLKVAKRGLSTEVLIPNLRRLAVVVFA